MKLIKKNNMLSSEFGEMTLNDLFARDDVEIHKKGNKVKLKKKTDHETMTIEICNYENTQTLSKATTIKDRPFNQMGNTIKQLRSEGRTQSEVADILGTTQTNISRIENKMKY